MVMMVNSSADADAVFLPEWFSPSERDVVCGWARQNHKHPGNQRFRKLVDHSAPLYIAASSKLEKTQVIASVVDKVRRDSPGGGFVKRDFQTGLWFEIGDDKARDKVGHAIRRSIEENKKRKSKAKDAAKKRKESSDKATDDNKSLGSDSSVDSGKLPLASLEDFEFDDAKPQVPKTLNVKKGLTALQAPKALLENNDGMALPSLLFQQVNSSVNNRPFDPNVSQLNMLKKNFGMDSSTNGVSRIDNSILQNQNVSTNLPFSSGAQGNSQSGLGLLGGFNQKIDNMISMPQASSGALQSFSNGGNPDGNMAGSNLGVGTLLGGNSGMNSILGNSSCQGNALQNFIQMNMGPPDTAQLGVPNFMANNSMPAMPQMSGFVDASLNPRGMGSGDLSGMFPRGNGLNNNDSNYNINNTIMASNNNMMNTTNTTNDNNFFFNNNNNNTNNSFSNNNMNMNMNMMNDTNTTNFFGQGAGF